MFRIALFAAAWIAFDPGGKVLCGHVVNATPQAELTGTYARVGIVDPIVEAQSKGSGIVLVEPVFIDELLACKKGGTREDSEFILQKQGSGYVIILPKVGVSCALVELGTLEELPDGELLLRSSCTLSGEGRINPIRGDQEDRFWKEKREDGEWLVVATRIKWRKRTLFRSTRMEYRSLVRFREIKPEPKGSL